MIVKWPGQIKAGTTTDHMSAFWDILPTMTELAHAMTPVDIDGISFLPILLGQKQKEHKYLYWEFHERGGRRAVRKDQWKLILYDVKTDNPRPIELYDIINDPRENKNLAESYPEIVEKLSVLLENRSVSPIPEWNF
jgi:arylsulfatase A-like enzyme